MHETWSHNLSIFIDKISKNRLITQNCSVNGNTTRQALERFNNDVGSKKPLFVLIQFGMNDCNYWDTDHGQPRVSELAFKYNLKEIINKSFASGVKTIFLGTNHPSLKKNFNTRPDLSHYQVNERYNNIIREVERENKNINLVLIDNEKRINNEIKTNNNSLSDYLLNDGIHLSKMGHSVYFDNVSKIIKSIINF